MGLRHLKFFGFFKPVLPYKIDVVTLFRITGFPQNKVCISNWSRFTQRKNLISIQPIYDIHVVHGECTSIINLCKLFIPDLRIKFIATQNLFHTCN